MNDKRRMASQIPRSSSTRQKTMLAILCACQVIGLLVLARVTAHDAYINSKRDLHLYWNSCLQMSQGDLPYISFHFEYPPLAALIFTFPRLIGSWHRPTFGFYQWAFAIQSAITAAMITPSIAIMANRAGRSVVRAVLIYTVFLLLLHPVVIWRFDIFPALMTALAVASLVEQRPWAAGFWLGLGVAAKLYPIVLLGLFLGHAIARRRWSDGLRITIAIVTVNLLILLRFLSIGSTAFLSFIRFHAQRGVQLESIWAGIMLIGQHLTLTTVSLVSAFGAYEVHGPWAPPLLHVQMPLIMILLIIVTALSYRQMRLDQLRSGTISVISIVTSAFALLLVFAAVNKVFSPQYLVWLIPFASLLGPSRKCLLMAISVLTMVMFLYCYSWVSGLQLRGAILLNIRNVLAIVLVVAMVADLSRSTQRDNRSD